MKKKSRWILCMILFVTFTVAGCSKAKEEGKNGDTGTDKNTENTVDVMDIYNKKSLEYIDADFYKGYEIYSGGTSYAKRILYNAVDDGSTISGYAANIQLFALEKGAPKEEDCLKFAEVEFMQYMDSGADNIVQMSCIIKTSDKKKRTFVLRFANEERTRVVQYIENGEDGEYKEIDNSYIEKAGKIDNPRYFYTHLSDMDCLLKDMESGEILSFHVNESELTFGKNVNADYACDIILAKADDEHREDSIYGPSDDGTVFLIQTNGKNAATVAVIYDEKGYKIFQSNEFYDEASDTPDSEKIEGSYLDREALEKKLGEIL